MKPVIINRIALGEGLPKICIPITARTEAEIITEAETLRVFPHQLVEWRADFFDEVTDPKAVRKVLAGIRRALPKDLLIFTFRTKKEGGFSGLSEETYLSICREVLAAGFCDLMDLELFTGYPDGASLSSEQLSSGALSASPLIPLIELAHEHGIYIILSNHDFQKTPCEELLSARFAAMEAIGGDIAKIAVMPQSRADVITLMRASQKASETLSCPVISMSMGSLGVVSRLSGSLTGSCLTFGTAGRASAPGQIPANELEDILKIIG